MARVFLSHKTEDKPIVLPVRDYLARCLVSAWLDSDEMYGGSKLNSGILQGIATRRYFVAFISHRYVRSDWCMHELEEVDRYVRSGKVVILPVLLDSVEDLKLNELARDRALLVESILERYVRIQFDLNNGEKSATEIAAAIGRHDGILFYPVKQTVLHGEELQLIRFEITTSDGMLPPDFLSRWDVNIEHDFVACHEGENKPIHARKPVALNGKGPGWLYAFLALPFKNLCPVYVFNSQWGEYICVYDSGKPPQRQGARLKAS
jgi:TIR domain